jgi:hypothetical protein
MSAIAVVLLAIVILALPAAGILAYLGYYYYKRSVILSSPSGAVSDLRPGVAKIRGTVAARGGLLTSPLTGRPCVYYRFRVKEEHRKVHTKSNPGVTTTVFGAVHGKDVYASTNQRTTWTWVTVVEEEQGIPIGVQDQSGEAALDLDQALVDIGDAETIDLDETNIPRDSLSKLLKHHRVWVVDEDGRPKKIRITEEVLADGAKVTAVGSVWARDGKAGFEGKPQVSDRGFKRLAKDCKTRAVILASTAGGLMGLVLGLSIVIVLLR